MPRNISFLENGASMCTILKSHLKDTELRSSALYLESWKTVLFGIQICKYNNLQSKAYLRPNSFRPNSCRKISCRTIIDYVWGRIPSGQILAISEAEYLQAKFLQAKFLQDNNRQRLYLSPIENTLVFNRVSIFFSPFVEGLYTNVRIGGSSFQRTIF